MALAKPAGYKLATYKSSEGPRAGLVIGEEVFDAAKLTGKPAYATVLGILADWKTAEGALKKAAAGAGKSRAKRQPLKKTKLLAPVQFPRRSIAPAPITPTMPRRWRRARAVRRRPIRMSRASSRGISLKPRAPSPIPARLSGFPTTPRRWTGRSSLPR